MFKKIVAAVGTVALALGLVALVAGPASAHDHSVNASCSAVSVNLVYYQTQTNDATPNHVTVWIDDQTTAVTDQAFGASFSKSYALSTGKATHSYRLQVTAFDGLSYSFDTGVTTVSGCETAITATAPTSANAVCVAAGMIGSGGYTIPSGQSGVQYQIFDTAKQSWVAIGAGTYAASIGSTIKLQAVATTGYKLTGTSTWTFTITGPPYSSNCVVPVPPTANPAACTSTPGTATAASYTVPKAPSGYKYYLSGSTTALAAGTVVVTTFPTTIVIVAKASAPNSFPAGTVTSWTFSFTSAGDCVGTSVAVAPTVSPAVCTTSPGQSTDNTYTIYPTTGAHFQVKIGNGAFVDALPGTYSLGKVATSIVIVALPDANYQMSGQTTFPFSFSAAPDCLTTVIPNATATAAVCDTAHPGQQFSGSYTLDAVTGVVYTVSTNKAAYLVTAAGTYSVANGTDIRVLATASTGYRVVGSPSWHFAFAATVSCLQDAKFVQPVATSQTCVVDGAGDGGLGQLGGSGTSSHLVQAFITIPSTVGVQYSIDGVARSAGDVVLPPGTYQVTAAATTGYQLAAGYPVGGWAETLTSAEPCGDLITHPLVDPAATQVQLQCAAGGSYTLSNDLGDSAAIVWTVNGSPVAQGTYKVSSAGTVTVHAVANGPTYGLEQGATQDWTFTFVTPTSCELKTLALTGSSPTNWLVLGYLMLILGLTLVAIRHLRRRGTQG